MFLTFVLVKYVNPIFNNVATQILINTGSNGMLDTNNGIANHAPT